MTERLQNADLSGYRSLSRFENVEELNAAIRSHFYINKHHLTDNVIAVFKTIIRYATKVPGVAFLKHESIADQVGISVSTVKRAIRVLKARGMIEVRRTIRSRGTVRGGYGHNVFVVVEPSADLPDLTHRPEAENTVVARVEPSFSDGETMFFETGSLSDKKQIRNNVSPLDHSYIPAHIPKAFVTAAQPLYDTEEIYQLWGRVKHAYNHTNIDREITDERIVNALVSAFKDAVFMNETGRLLNSLGAYFYGACRHIFKEVYDEELDELIEEAGIEFNEENMPGWMLGIE